MDQVDHSENRESHFQLKNNRIPFYTDKIALLKNVFENQDLKKNSAA